RRGVASLRRCARRLPPKRPNLARDGVAIVMRPPVTPMVGQTGQWRQQPSVEGGSGCSEELGPPSDGLVALPRPPGQQAPSGQTDVLQCVASKMHLRTG